MPLSNPEHIPAVLHFVQSCQPRAVLDVGVGTGSYGLLLRQSLDIGYGRIEPASWQVKIDGVEIFEPYRNPVWSFAYSRVLMGDIRQLRPSLGKYDVILANDVLEHFPREEARALVKDLLSCGRVLIATTPNRDFPQGAWGGNEAETHHSLLDRSDFAGLVATVETGVTTCYICTADREAIYPLLLAADRCVQVRPATPMSLPTRLRRKWRQWRLTR
jgi:SAM-dependent methyltransferase